jgi:superfamily I DNA/RNA helicase
VTFSKAAADDAKKRLGKEHNVTACTIHSLMFHITGTKKNQIMTDKDFSKAAATIGMPPSKRKNTKTRNLSTDYANPTDRSLAKTDLLRVNDKFNDRIFLTGIDTDLNNAVLAYKKENYKKDFIDLLEQGSAALDTIRLDFDVLIVDELQDLSKLQWDIVYKLMKAIPSVYMAGDDDQEIYSFAGSDTEEMLSLKDKGFEVEELDQSYRLPKSVHSMSKSWIRRIEDRYPKNFRCRNGAGTIIRAEHLAQVPQEYLEDSDILFLTRTQYLKDYYMNQLTSILPVKEKNFKTMHASKGLEARTVVVFDHITSRVQSHGDMEKEIKLYYVAMTRAKENLIIVGSKKTLGLMSFCRDYLTEGHVAEEETA